MLTPTTDSYLRFNNEFIDEILRGDKTMTARYGNTGDIVEDDVVPFIDEDGEKFAYARISHISEMTIEEFATTKFEGHQTYDSIEDCINSFAEYYPRENLHPETTLTIFKFKNATAV